MRTVATLDRLEISHEQVGGCTERRVRIVAQDVGIRPQIFLHRWIESLLGNVFPLAELGRHTAELRNGDAVLGNRKHVQRGSLRGQYQSSRQQPALEGGANQ